MIGTIFLLALIGFEFFADIFAKQWSLSGSLAKLALAFLAYLLANSAWLWALRKGISLSRGALLFSVSSAILAFAIGVLIFKEPTSRFQLLGALFGIIALILLA